MNKIICILVFILFCFKPSAQVENVLSKFEQLDSLRLNTINSPFYNFYKRKNGCRNCKWINEFSFDDYQIELDKLKTDCGNRLSELLTSEENIKILIDEYTLEKESKLIGVIYFLMDKILIQEKKLNMLIMEISKTDNQIGLAVLFDFLAIKNNIPQRFGTRKNSMNTMMSPHLPINKIISNRSMVGLGIKKIRKK